MLDKSNAGYSAKNNKCKEDHTRMLTYTLQLVSLSIKISPVCINDVHHDLFTLRSILHDIVDVHLTCTSTGVVPNPSRATLLLICHTAHARFRNFSRITCGDFIPQGEFNIDNHNLEVFLPPMDKLVRCEEYGMATTPDYSHFLARIPDCE